MKKVVAQSWTVLDLLLAPNVYLGWAPADQMGETTGSRVEKHKFLIPRLLSFTMVSFSTQCWLGFWLIGNHHRVQTCKVAFFQSDIYFHVNVKYVSMNEPLQQAKINEIMMSQALFFSSHIFEIIAFSYYTTAFKTHQLQLDLCLIAKYNFVPTYLWVPLISFTFCTWHKL